MNYELSGIVHKIHDTQTFASGFQKREFVIEETEGKYPQQIKLEAVKDGCTKLDNYEEGDAITVSFNIRGNEHNGKHYVSLQAWKFEGQGTRGQKPSPPPQDAHNKAKANAYAPEADDDSDVPF